MWNFYLILGSLFLLCHGAGGQRQCTELLKSCPKIYCNSVINSPLKCAGCFNISAVCVRLKRSNPSCELYFGEDKYDCDSREKDSHEEQISNLLEKDSNDSTDSNNTTVIVVAVCVSLVVIIISVLIAVVYCWRVRRVSRERKKQGNVETRQRNSQTNIEVTENNLETSRPNSTYCTINDMGNTNEYHVLEPQDATEVNVVDRDRDLSDYCANVTIAKHGVDRVDVSNDADYNRIVFNQIKEAKPDPSYSHLDGVEPLYGGDAESINKVSGYQYGVPIKIRNKNQLQSSEHDLTNNIKPVMNSNAKDKIENTEYEVNAETKHLENSYKMKPDNGADDDYVIPKEGQRNSMNTIDGKPKAIVNPIVNLDDNELTTEVIKNQCDKDTVRDDQEDTSRNSDVQSERIDDYELAAFKNSVSSEKVDVSNAKIELPTVRKDYNTKQITEDGYEKAVVNTAILSEKSDIVKGKLELPTVQILHNTKQMTDDGYETAVINKVETVDVDKNN